MYRQGLNDREKRQIIEVYDSFPNREVIDFKLAKACREKTARGFAEIVEFLKSYILETYGIDAVKDFSDFNTANKTV